MSTLPHVVASVRRSRRHASRNRTLGTGCRLPHGFSTSRQSQSRAARGGHAAARVGADPRRRGQRQDARADDAHRVAAGHRAGEPAVDPRRDVHQQGREGDADAAVGDDADAHARHVARHLPRPVQSHAARALPRRRAAAGVPDPRHAGPARADQARVSRARTSTTSAIRRASCSTSSRTPRNRACGRTRSRRIDEFTRRQVEHYALYEAACQREGVVDFAELLLRSYELLANHEQHPRALSAALLAPARRRVPGHERAAVQVAAAARRPADAPCSRWATTTSRSTRFAAPTWRTCSTSSATSAAPSCRCASSSSSRTIARTATSSMPRMR